MKSQRRQLHINWPSTLVLIAFHIGAIAALFMFSWQGLGLALVLAWLAGGLGVGMGYHRLLTHRGYKAPTWVEYVLTVCGTLSLEGGPINWVVTHRLHHQHTEEPGKDPHTPREGKWWSHMGWILRGTAQQHPEAVLRQYAPDLYKAPFHVLLNRFYYVPLIILSLSLLLIGGWSLLLWGVALRVTVGLHATWLVNSATHLWGTRRFATKDDSRNNWWVALLTWGEGWHNNHHANPVAARHGLAWYEIDFNWWGIRVLKLARLANSIKVTSKTELSASKSSLG